MKAILHDVSRCTGCRKCVQACAEDNHLYEDPVEARFDQGPLSERRFTTVDRTADGHCVRLQCMHCLEPSCVAACLVGALKKTDQGAVLYDAEKCIGCRYCMISCPYHVIRYEWRTNHPLIRKCDLCHDRSGGPACVEACPHEATMYGDRSALLDEAHARIAADPERYVQKVWGEEEAGGTCVLYVSDTDLDTYFPTAIGTTSIPKLTAPIVHATPYMAVGVASFLIGASWVINRRDRLAAEGAADEHA